MLTRNERVVKLLTLIAFGILLVDGGLLPSM